MKKERGDVSTYPTDIKNKGLLNNFTPIYSTIKRKMP